MPVCFVPKCDCEAATLIPDGPMSNVPICATHAVAWHGSEHRELAAKMRERLGSFGARKILVRWAHTEAQGMPAEQMWQEIPGLDD